DRPILRLWHARSQPGHHIAQPGVPGHAVCCYQQRYRTLWLSHQHAFSLESAWHVPLKTRHSMSRHHEETHGSIEMEGYQSVNAPNQLADDEDIPIPYIQRSRDWYQALGYANPYRYAHYKEVPFQRLSKPLAQSVVTLLTTAAPYQPDKGPQGPGAPYNAS